MLLLAISSCDGHSCLFFIALHPMQCLAQKLNEAAMKEAATRARCIIAIVTGLERDSDPEDNAYFKRPFCVNELRSVFNLTTHH